MWTDDEAKVYIARAAKGAGQRLGHRVAVPWTFAAAYAALNSATAFAMLTRCFCWCGSRNRIHSISAVASRLTFALLTKLLTNRRCYLTSCG